ncbi:NAD(P)-dependent dehydrogenase (short-subunit alcohol dehydrogenase family) [Streptomyces sp. V4I8]
MTTFALVGTGPDLGLATARRFGAAGHTVALIARNAGEARRPHGRTRP